MIWDINTKLWEYILNGIALAGMLCTIIITAMVLFGIVYIAWAWLETKLRNGKRSIDDAKWQSKRAKERRTENETQNNS